jgi:hypothetical protein
LSEVSSRAAWEGAIAPLDRARQLALAYALAFRPLRRVLARRGLRIAVLGSVGVVVATVLAVVAPVALFVLGPLLLGVPHVASDLRHLVLRRELPSRVRTAAYAGCLALVGVRILSETHALRGSLDRVEWAVASAWILAAAAAGAASARDGRRGLRLALSLLPLALLAAVAERHATGARLVFVHAHNVVGVLAWLLLFRRRGGVALLPLATIALCTAWLVTSSDPFAWTGLVQGERAFRLHLLTVSDWLAPGLPARLALGIAYSYVLLQSVHYAVWLAWIPQEDTRAAGTLTFAMTARSWARDFGPAGVAVIAGAMAVVAAGALLQVHRARALYLSLAMFHGYLELAALAYFLARGGPPGARRQAPSACPCPT